MELTIYLSKVLGLALIILGAATMIRRHYFVPVFGSFAGERLLRAIISTIELIAGLFLIVAHTAWWPLPAAIISLLGWIAVIEGVAYLLLPDETVEKIVAAFNVPAWYIVGGLIALVAGIYLAGFGFGWW